MANTSTVYGTFLDAQGNGRDSALVQFEPIGAPYISDADIITSNVISVTLDASGSFTGLTLVEGTYRVVLSDLDAFEILVPGDGSDNDIETLITSVLYPNSGSTGGTSGPTPVSQQIDSSESVTVSQAGDAYGARKRLVLFGEGPVSTTDLFYGLVATFAPDELVVTGNLNTSGAAGTIDAAIGQQFSSWIYPYSGSYGSGSPDSVNHFWYALGNEDWVPTNVTAVTDYFTFPNNERYYKASLPGGVIALFVLDSSASEPDGNTYSSTQGSWLQTQLAAATEKVKIVVFRDSPVASKTGYSFANMDWPFASWGATMVVASGVKFVERITLDGGIPLFLVGGAWEQSSADTVGTPLADSQYRYNSNPAFLVLDINAYSYRAFFVDTAGQILDDNSTVLTSSYKVKPAVITKPNSGLIHSTTGISADFGSADGQVLSGTDLYTAIQDGRLVRVTALPSISEVRATPWYKNCLFLVGDDPPSGIYYWNRAYGDFSLFIAPSFVTSYYSGARPVLDPPTFSPTGGKAAGTAINHGVSGVIFYVSVDGASFVTVDPADSNKVYFGVTEGPHWVAAYATKTGYEDSSIAVAQFNA